MNYREKIYAIGSLMVGLLHLFVLSAPMIKGDFFGFILADAICWLAIGLGMFSEAKCRSLGAMVLVIVLLGICGSTAKADWNYLGGDRYSDGAWVYRAWYNCGWHYEKLYQVASSDDKFWDDAVRSEGALERGQQKKDYLEKRYGYRGGYGPQAGYGVASDSYTVSTQGIAPGYATGGTTLFGVAGYQPQVRIDPNPAIARAQRLAETAQGAATNAFGQSQAMLTQIVDGNTAEAKIRAAGEITVATIRAANSEPTTVTTSTRTWPQYPAASQQSNQQAQPALQMTPPTLPAPPTAEEMRPSDGINSPQQPRATDQSRQELDRTYALAQVGFQACKACHATTNPKGDVNLHESSFASLGEDARQALAKHVWDSTDPSLPANKRMPKGKPEALANSIREAMRFEILHPRGDSVAANY